MKLKFVLSVGLVLYVNLMLFVIGYFFVNSTVKKDYELAVKEAESLKGVFESARHQKINRDAYEGQQREVVAMLFNMKLRLPDTLSEEQLRTSIISRAKASKISATDFEHLSFNRVEFYGQHYIRMTLTGTYQDIVRYLHRLQTGKDIIVTSSDFSISVKPNNQVQLDGEFSAYQYTTYPGSEAAYDKLRKEYRDYDEAR